MAELIQAADVEAAHARHQRALRVPAGALVTPLARERARDLGIWLALPGEESEAMPMSCPGHGTGCSGAGAAAAPRPGHSPEQIRRLVAAVILRVMPGEFSPALVRQVTDVVLQRLAGRPAGGG